MKAMYNADTGHFDGLTKGKVYEIIDENETQFLGSTSTIQKVKFVNQD